MFLIWSNTAEGVTWLLLHIFSYLHNLGLIDIFWTFIYLIKILNLHLLERSDYINRILSYYLSWCFWKSGNLNRQIVSVFPLKRVYCSFISLGKDEISILLERMSRLAETPHTTTQRVVHIEKPPVRKERSVLRVLHAFAHRKNLPLTSQRQRASSGTILSDYWGLLRPIYL